MPVTGFPAQQWQPRLPQRRGVLRASVGVGGAVLLGAGLWGCAVNPDEDHRGADAPQALPLPKAPKMAWVFSSGGPRGFVHVGVVKALHEIGVQPDLVVGASVGALIATVCASGMPAADIESMALELNAVGIGRLALGGQERFSGSAIAGLVRQTLGNRPLHQLQMPVACVAMRKADGQLAAFTAGDAGLAVQASCAIEGQFTPVRIRGDQYVDPDRLQPLPVRLARSLGARRVLSVDASAHEDKAPDLARQRYAAGDQRKRQLTAPDAAQADLHLHPEFGYWVSLTREFRVRAIQAGYEATMAQANRIRALHAAA